MPVILTNAETEAVILYLDGITAGSHVLDGTVTNHPLSDGSQRTDGRIIRPRTLSISGTVGAFFSREGQLVGDERVDEVVGILRELQVAATRVSVSFPGRAPIDDMQVERFTEDFDPTENPPISIELKEVRTASRRAVLLEPTGASTGQPRAEFADGLEESQERGALPSKSISATIIDGVFGFAGLGSL